MEKGNYTVLVCLGPTGSGKTQFTSELDPQSYEIISCDSRQVYRGLEIGSAAPPSELQRRLRHHLVAFLEPSHQITAGIFKKLARDAIHKTVRQKKIPLIVGGSGFYYQALRTSMFSTDNCPKAQREVQSLNHDQRLALLKEKDPDALVQHGEAAEAGKIHPNDSYRVARAVAIFLSSGKRWSRLWQEKNSKSAESDLKFYGFRLTLQDMEQHRKTLLQRAAKMVALGIVEEAGDIYQRYGNCPALSSLGYQEALQAYFSKEARGSLVEKLGRAHYQYSRNQRNWLRRERGLQAVSPQDFPQKLQALAKKLYPHLQSHTSSHN